MADEVDSQEKRYQKAPTIGIVQWTIIAALAVAVIGLLYFISTLS